MERYDNNPIINTKPTVQYPKIIRYRSSTRYPDIPLTENDVFLYTMRGDRLDNLAYQFYNDSTLWWVIAMANELPGDSLYLEIGIQLRIPANISAVLNEYIEYNRL